jgi:serine/threonine protein kinase
MSPEQTGRMNIPVDYRSDFYSLGIVLYQLLCGVLPFTSCDPREIIFCHLAKKPTSPYKYFQRNKFTSKENLVGQNTKIVPEVVSNIIMKLLNKNPDDRYQSSKGLFTDLQICKEEYLKKGRIDDFQIGSNDFSERLIIPNKLYGHFEE